MAPTGRAAKRMTELLDLESKTIHRHLGYNYDGMFGYDHTNLLPYELIIIDEASMIDLNLASKLFQSIKTGCQVVIVGDVDQLPSVGAGQFLSDLIESNIIPVVRLEQIHRQAKDSKIIRLAQLVNAQNVNASDLVSDQDVYLYKAHPNQIIHIMKNQIKGAMNEGYRLYEDIQVLAPMYKGDLGIDRLNQVLQETFNDNYKDQMTYGDKVYRIGDKVIQLVNDPERLIMNGDLGVIKDIRYNSSDQPYLMVSYAQNDVTYEKADLEDLNLAYAMSIHKSQGSEYPIVIIPMVRNFIHMLKKELIYTAITRAKKYLIFLGDMQLLIYAANHLSEKRKTTLAKRLNED
jgi:exodeoxyribonuclease V alpha subunit